MSNVESLPTVGSRLKWLRTVQLSEARSKRISQTMVCTALWLKYEKKLSTSRLSEIENAGMSGKESVEFELLSQLVDYYGSNLNWVVYGPQGGYYQPTAGEGERIDAKTANRLEKIRKLSPDDADTVDAIIAHFESKGRR